MTLDELTTLVNDQRRDTTDNFVDTDEIERLFNQFARRINAEHDFQFTQTSAGISYVDGTNEYALSAIGNGDFKAPIELFYSYQYDIEYVSKEDFDYLKSGGNGGNYWSSDNRNLYIFTSFGTNTLSCTYYSNYMAQTSGGSWQSALSTSDDSPLMPEMFQDAYVEYALAKIFKKEGAVEDSAESQGRLDRLIRDLKNEYVSNRQVVSKRFSHITDSPGSMAMMGDKKYNPLGWNN